MERHIYHQIIIPATLEDVVPILAESADDLLGPSRQRAADGDDPVAILHAHFLGVDTRHEVHIDAEPIEMVARHTYRMRLTWQATHSEKLYPVMQGELEVAAHSVNPPLSDLSFIGHYRPPMGLIGAAADAIAGHNIAQEAVISFVEEFRDRLLARLEVVATPTAAATSSA